jgi:hypothetical protein
VPWVAIFVVNDPHSTVPVLIVKLGQSRKQASLTTKKPEATEHPTLYDPVQPAGQAIETIAPLPTPGNVKSPQLTVVIGVARQLPEIHPSVTDPNVPFVHVALTVPVHPAGHGAELTLPLVVPGIVTDPHCAIDAVEAGQSGNKSQSSKQELGLPGSAVSEPLQMPSPQ